MVSEATIVYRLRQMGPIPSKWDTGLCKNGVSSILSVEEKEYTAMPGCDGVMPGWRGVREPPQECMGVWLPIAYPGVCGALKPGVEGTL